MKNYQVHLPLPLLPENGGVPVHSPPPHFVSPVVNTEHNHENHHYPIHDPMLTMASDPMMQSGPPMPLIIRNPSHNEIPVPLTDGLTAESEVFPIEMIPVFMKDDSLGSIGNG